jgi:hypothetical protein
MCDNKTQQRLKPALPQITQQKGRPVVPSCAPLLYSRHEARVKYGVYFTTAACCCASLIIAEPGSG